MDSTQKAVKNQEICEPLQGNLGITQSSGLDRLSGYPDKRSKPVMRRDSQIATARKRTITGVRLLRRWTECPLGSVTVWGLKMRS